MTTVGQQEVEPYLRQALDLAQRGDTPGALVAVERALELAPGSVDAHLAKGRILRLASGDLGATVRAFRRAVEAATPSARRVDCLREYAVALGKIGRHREAAAALDEAIDLAHSFSLPAGARGELADLSSRALEKTGEADDVERALSRHRAAEAHYRDDLHDLPAFYAREAELLERLGRFGELVDTYARLLEADPDRVLFAQPDVAKPSNATRLRYRRLLEGLNACLAERRGDAAALIFKAGFFFRLARFPQAEQQLKRALAAAPDHFYAHHMLGKVYLGMGRARAALEALERARPLAPEYMDLAKDRAIALELCERHAEALEAYVRLETRWPGRRDLILRAARLQERLGRLGEAYELYRRAAALARPSADAESLVKLATLALELGRPAEAVPHLDEAVARAPGEQALRLLRAGAREAAADVAGALEDLDAALGLAAERRDIFYREALARRAGLLIRRVARPEEGLVAADLLLEIDPENVEALLLKGDGLKALKRFAESVDWYKRAADRKVSDALVDEGEKLWQEASYGKALGKWNEAFRRNPRSWEILYHAAAAYACLGQAGPAARYLEAAARISRSALAFMERDHDWDSVRRSPELAEVLARLQSQSEAPA